MARMHSRKRGKSGSTKPAEPKKPTWVTLKPKEIEMLVSKYSKEGKTASQIGLYLRDEYGVPSVKDLTGKSVSAILKEKKMSPDIPEDLMALMRKAVMLRKHMAANKKDMPGKRGLQLTESKINRLGKYYKRSGVLPTTWKYSPEEIRLLVE